MNKCLFGKEQEIDTYLEEKGRVNENYYFKNMGF